MDMGRAYGSFPSGASNPRVETRGYNIGRGYASSSSDQNSAANRQKVGSVSTKIMILFTILASPGKVFKKKPQIARIFTDFPK